MVNFYRRFIPSMASIIAPLTELTKPSVEFHWGKTEEMAFSASKSALASAALLSHPVDEAELSLAVDASSSHVGGVLQQDVKGKLQALAFFSRKLSASEVMYSAFDRELLALFASIRHFRFLLEARRFFVTTDHKPLIYALRRKSPPWTARQQRQLAYISEFTVDIRHVPGASNVVADCLSRPPEIAAVNHSPLTTFVPDSVDFSAIASAQKSCPDVKLLKGKEDLKIVPFNVTSGLLWCDVSTGLPRPLLPSAFRRDIFNVLHNLAHPGIRTSRRLICSRFLWPGMNKDVNAWARLCVQCQKSKVQCHVKPPPQQFVKPTRRFDHVHVDIVGPLPVSGGFSHVLTCVDRFSRWPEVLPLVDTKTETCVRAFVGGWIARFGVPSQITSDRGAQFASALWGGICQLMGVKQVWTTAFHPQSNGLVERFHRSLKASLRARLAGHDWISHLPWILLGLRAAPRDHSDVSAAEFLYGETLCLPGQFVDGFSPPSDDFLRRYRSLLAGITPPPFLHNSTPSAIVPSSLQTVPMVFVRKDGIVPTLAERYEGPYQVVARGKSAFRLQMGHRSDWVSIARLKPAVCDDFVPPAVPRRRGRPAVAVVPPPPRRPRGRPRKTAG